MNYGEYRFVWHFLLILSRRSIITCINKLIVTFGNCKNRLPRFHSFDYVRKNINSHKNQLSNDNDTCMFVHFRRILKIYRLHVQYVETNLFNDFYKSVQMPKGLVYFVHLDINREKFLFLRSATKSELSAGRNSYSILHFIRLENRTEVHQIL